MSAQEKAQTATHNSSSSQEIQRVLNSVINHQHNGDVDKVVQVNVSFSICPREQSMSNFQEEVVIFFTGMKSAGKQ